ncbi:CHAT domain-containing protein [Streptomyces sp. R41]|uniref:CHAT domain-containing protein n=1 Tax=Streptomyces sp. R41 TaxID=3238632 RepID=A0AB39RTR0_9ACTN
MEVLDFQAEITATEPQVYEIALRGPDGAETSTRTRLPLSPEELRILAARIPDAVIASSARVRRSASPDEQPVQLLGRSLFETLTAGDGRALLAAARHTAAREERHLRLVLRVRPPELARLPWEFLFDPGLNGYVCQTASLIRHPQVPVPQRPLRVEPPLRILCMIARPEDQEVLAVELEKERLGGALEELQRDGLIELGWVGGETWRDLRAALRPGHGPWHIFHFIGHGGFDRVAQEGSLALADGSGGTYQLGAESLAMVLHGHPSLRLVVLNACETGRAGPADPFSSVGGALMRAGVPAALAMQYPVSDRAAVEFSRSFYEALALRRGVDAAVMDARQSILLELPGTLEWGTPVLYMRSLDGLLFDIGQEPAARPTTDVDELYVQGLAALYTERWDDAVAAFRAVAARDRAYRNSAAKLEEALRRRRLHHLYIAALGAADSGHWDAAVEHLSAILDLDPDYRDVRGRLELARTRQARASLRAEALALHAAGQWDAVLAIGERFAQLSPDDPDPDGVVAAARREVAGRTPSGDAEEVPTQVAGPGVPRARVVELATPKAAWSVAFRPDGRSVAVGCDKRSATIFDLDGHHHGTTRPPLDEAALKGLGLVAALGVAGGVLAAIQTAGSDERVLCLAFTPDGRRIAMSGNSKVRVCDSDTGKLVVEIAAGKYDVSAVAFCGNSQLVAASHHLVGIWTVERPTRIVNIDHQASVYAVAVSPDRTRLVTAGRSSVRVWDARTGDRLLQVEYSAMVFGVDFHPEGGHFATAGLDRTARVWDATTGECVVELELADRVRCVAFSPDGTRLAVASGTAVSVWDPTARRKVFELDGDFGPVTMLKVAYSPEGRHLAAVGGGKAWLIPLPEERSV